MQPEKNDWPNMIDRRSALTAIALATFGYSGCLAAPKSTQNPDGENDMGLHLSKATLSVSELPQMNGTATIQSSTWGTETPAIVAISLEWTGEETVEFGFGNTVTFDSPTYSEPETKGALLLRRETEVDRVDGSHWVPESQEGGLGSLTRAAKYRFEPGQSVTQEFGIWGDHRCVDRIHPGRYGFTGEMDRLSATEGTPSSYSISLEIEIQ